MPVAVSIESITSITRPEELVEFLYDYLIDMPGVSWGYVAKYDEQLFPKYPALHIQAANVRKALHATHRFAVELNAAIHILHANFNVDRQTRNYEDLVLATSVVNYLESDMAFKNPANSNKPRIIHGWVESEIPGILPPRVTKGEAVVSTRLMWTGINQRSF